MPEIDGRARDLLEAPNFCHVATLRADGSAHVVPVWVDTDGEHVVLNSAEGRVWVRNADRDPRVTCTVSNRDNPYEYVTITGTVAERTHDGADAHIDAMARKYLGEDTYPSRRPAEQRVIFRVRPDRVRVHGSG
jgi:PPOX class probable F420-dependent enzyme